MLCRIDKFIKKRLAPSNAECVGSKNTSIDKGRRDRAQQREDPEVPEG